LIAPIVTPDLHVNAGERYSVLLKADSAGIDWFLCSFLLLFFLFEIGLSMKLDFSLFDCFFVFVFMLCVLLNLPHVVGCYHMGISMLDREGPSTHVIVTYKGWQCDNESWVNGMHCSSFLNRVEVLLLLLLLLLLLFFFFLLFLLLVVDCSWFGCCYCCC
jgi:hypothetical protein